MSTGEQNKNGLKTETDGFGVAVNQWQCGMLESKDKTEIWLPTVSKSPMKYCITEIQEFLQSFSESQLHDVQDLFKDISESETKFYR
jgi:thiaminase